VSSVIGPLREVEDVADRGGSFAAAQLGAVAPGELVETFRSVPVPTPQLRAGSDVTKPGVETRILLAQTAWPQPIDEQTSTIAALGNVIDPPDANPVGR